MSTLASIGLNVMAPDEGNMHVLLHAGDEDQKERGCDRSRRAASARAF